MTYFLLPSVSGVSFLCSQKAFEDLVVLQQVQKPPPKENLASTSLNTPAPSGYIPEQDLKTNQKQVVIQEQGC